jgi:hypothetical protein
MKTHKYSAFNYHFQHLHKDISYVWQHAHKEVHVTATSLMHRNMYHCIHFQVSYTQDIIAIARYRYNATSPLCVVLGIHPFLLDTPLLAKKHPLAHLYHCTFNTRDASALHSKHRHISTIRFSWHAIVSHKNTVEKTNCWNDNVPYHCLIYIFHTAIPEYLTNSWANKPF